MATIKSREIVASFLREKHVFVSDDLAIRTIIGQATLTAAYGGDVITLKGEASEGSLMCGIQYRFYGKTVTHPAYGNQFHFDSFVVDKPATREAVVAYLRQCPGFGVARSGVLWDLFGEQSIDQLIADPKGVCGKIKGLKIDDAKAASALLKTSEATRKTKLELIELISGRGFPRKLTDILISDFGSAAAESIRKNPYLLLKYSGCGFGKVDQFYLEIGGDPSSMERQSLCAWNAIQRFRGGDTWHPYNTAAIAVRESISGADAKPDEAVELAVKNGKLAFRNHKGQKWVTEATKASHEERIALLLAQSHQEQVENSELVLWSKLLPGINVYEHQRQQLQIACQGFVACLAGGPGTGKTHCAAELIKQAQCVIGLDNIAACAPSGKAAVRMTEAFSKAGIDGFRATTTHSLLGWGGEDFFAYDETNPLPFKLIVADETSMKDTWLLGCLLAARGRGCHVLFLGDTEQLSPVGHGAPFRDLMLAGIPTGILTEVQRNSGRIVKACKEIRETRRFDASPKLDLGAGENLLVINASDSESQLKSLASVIQRIQQGGTYDPLWDLQVLCAVNKKTSLLNRNALNLAIQGLLNPHGQTAKGSPFRVGDKVICLKNGKYPRAGYTPQTRRYEADDEPIREGEPKAKDADKIYVANGEQGEVLSCDSTRMTVRLFHPDREVIVYRKAQSDDAESQSEDDDKGSGCDWDLGYAVSVHKSQGSEWKVVVVILDASAAARQVCSRNWIYTAISRAKTLCILIGTEKTATEMCQRPGLDRKTFLRELIEEEIQDAKRGQAMKDLAELWSDSDISELLGIEGTEVETEIIEAETEEVMA